MIRDYGRWLIIGAVILILGIQLVPYGRDHSNPTVTAEPAWDSPATQNLVMSACKDCHTNETVWPWYSNIAPISWLVQHDVDEGRHRLNYSEWDRPQGRDSDEAARLVQQGEMPPWYFKILHPEAKLSAADTQALIQGLQATFGR